MLVSAAKLLWLQWYKWWAAQGESLSFVGDNLNKTMTVRHIDLKANTLLAVQSRVLSTETDAIASVPGFTYMQPLNFLSYTTIHCCNSYLCQLHCLPSQEATLLSKVVLACISHCYHTDWQEVHRNRARLSWERNSETTESCPQISSHMKGRSTVISSIWWIVTCLEIAWMHLSLKQRIEMHFCLSLT